MQTLEQQYLDLKQKETDIKQEIIDIKELLVLEYKKDPEHTFNGLTVYHTAGKRTTAWKDVAIELQPPQGLIDAYTKTGKDSFGIRIKKEPENE